MALCSMSPDLCDLLKYLQDQVSKMNNLNINSCQAAEGIVTAAGSLLTDRTQEKEGKTAGASLNLFGDVFESWDEWKKSRVTARNIRTAARNASRAIASSSSRATSSGGRCRASRVSAMKPRNC
jgi:conjugative transfer pilus assembly protein TraH